MTKKALCAIALSLLALLTLAPAGMAGAYERPAEGSPLAYAYVDGTLRFEDIFITAARVNMRSGPGLSYARVGKLGKGVLITRTQQQGLWVKIVTVNGTDAWIYSPYLAPVTSGNIMLVTTAVNVRKGPGTRYAIIGGLNPGALVLTVDKTGKWIKVCFEGGYGYIYADYLQVYAKPISSPAAASSSGGGGTPRNTPSPTPTPTLTPSPTALEIAIARADEVLNFTFTPATDFLSYDYLISGTRTRLTYEANKEYHGVPYGQAKKPDDAHLLLHVTSLTAFTAAVADTGSKVYTDQSYVGNNGVTAPYYNLDCSGYVSYILGVARYRTWEFDEMAADSANEDYYYGTYANIHAGDILNIPHDHARWVYKVEGDTVYYYEQTSSTTTDLLTQPATRQGLRTKTVLENYGYQVIHVKRFDYLAAP
ncbi:MAG: SH3 domain-containing protein [Christensenellaceae bacterium]|jgi:uncharacterized protein YraI|nr:SH3 domain-containing protein [Christensenellaceae bacterium]